MRFDNFLVGRQPIFDREERIFGYEFLFRKTGTDERAEFYDSVTATSRVLINIFQNFGIKSLTNDRKAFINIDDNIILQDVLDVLPKENLVLEIVETTNVTPEVIDRVSAYHKAGYIFALDDFVLTQDYFSMFMPLFPFTEYLKLDMKENCLSKMERVQKIFKGRHMKMLAEKVETRLDFDFTYENGFELFQGYFFEKPAVIEKKNIEPSKASILRILSKLSRNSEISEIESDFRIQPELTIKLLKVINTCSYSIRNEVTSIRHALNLIGRDAMRKWLTIMLYAGRKGDPVKSTLLETAMLKAHVLELLAGKVFGEKHKSLADAFFIGLLSHLDVILGVTKEELLEMIKVHENISRAILHRDNELGELLTLLEATDDAQSELNLNLLKKYRITGHDLTEIKFKGLEWLSEQQELYNNI
jgi:EAL and modified HD-GYP domain-containing signal transduction protein